MEVRVETKRWWNKVETRKTRKTRELRSWRSTHSIGTAGSLRMMVCTTSAILRHASQLMLPKIKRYPATRTNFAEIAWH